MKKALIVTRVSGFVPQFEMNNVKILQEMGYEVHYASNFDTVVYGKDNSRLEGTGIICHNIPFCRSPLKKEVYESYRILKQLMLAEEFELIHCHMPMTGILTRKAAEAVRRKTKRNTKVIYTAHGFHFFRGAPLKNWIYYLPERWFARYTDRLILMNEEDYKRAETFPVRGNVEKIPGVGMKEMPAAGSTFSLRGTYGIPEENMVVVSVGELTPLKNHETMIRAMAQLDKAPVTYVICGCGPLEERLNQLIEELHVQEKVVMAGYCYNVPDILRQADVFAFPSKREGLPVAMMEAMQAGLPVLAARIRGNTDLIEDRNGGFLFEKNQEEDYVRAIRYLLENPEVGIYMGKWNKERVKNFSLDRVDKKMRKIYEECVGVGERTLESRNGGRDE